MAGTIAVLLFLARVIITIHIKIFLFLIKHFDITNGLIVSLFAQVLTQDLQINIWIRVALLVFIMVGCIVLQHLFKPSRIVFGLVSSFFFGLMAYGLFKGSKIFPWIPFFAAFMITCFLNFLSWIRIDSKKAVDKPDGERSSAL